MRMYATGCLKGMQPRLSLMTPIHRVYSMPEMDSSSCQCLAQINPFNNILQGWHMVYMLLTHI